MAFWKLPFCPRLTQIYCLEKRTENQVALYANRQHFLSQAVTNPHSKCFKGTHIFSLNKRGMTDSALPHRLSLVMTARVCWLGLPPPATPVCVCVCVCVVALSLCMCMCYRIKGLSGLISFNWGRTHYVKCWIINQICSRAALAKGIVLARETLGRTLRHTLLLFFISWKQTHIISPSYPVA